jgi:nucleotide-binding universal stress UspA family protein
MKKILVPLDGSAFAEQAIDTARAIALHNGASLEFVAVLEPTMPPSRVSGAPPLDPRLDNELRANRADYLAKLEQAERQHGMRDAVGVLRDGRPADEIADQASAGGADLIVMTTHGRGGFERLWLGSVADGVIRAATVPVLLVRPASGGEPGGGVALNRIVVGLAGTEQDDAVVNAALTISDPVRASYTLVHVTPPSPIVATVDPAVAPPQGEIAGAVLDANSGLVSDAEGYLDRMARTFRERTASVETRAIRSGGAGRSLVDVAEEVRANLIVVGTSARAGIKRVLMGSVSDKVVRTATCSVLVVPTNEASR